MTVDYTKIGEQMNRKSSKPENLNPKPSDNKDIPVKPAYGRNGEKPLSRTQMKRLENFLLSDRKLVPTPVLVALMTGGFLFWPLFIVAIVLYHMNKTISGLKKPENKTAIKQAIKEMKFENGLD